MTKPAYSGPWHKIRAQVLSRDNYQCQIAGPRCTNQAEHVDHIHPVAFGGAWYDLDNLRASCAKCNLGRSQRRRQTASRTW